VNDLLSRKSTWSDDDVSRFTKLVREDHAREQAETAALAAVTTSEEQVEREFDALMRAILSRYHEEQVWSDKIRSASTYGSLAVLGLNLLVFVLATLLVEPWKRRRLAATFERKVEEMDARQTALLEGGLVELTQRLEAHERSMADVHTAVSALHANPPAHDTPAGSVISDELKAELPSKPVEVPSWIPYAKAKQALPAWAPDVTPEGAIVALSTAAFVGGSVAGWLIREWRH
jgi:sensitive to high expression protein 9, mitochondrial